MEQILLLLAYLKERVHRLYWLYGSLICWKFFIISGFDKKNTQKLLGSKFSKTKKIKLKFIDKFL